MIYTIQQLLGTGGISSYLHYFLYWKLVQTGGWREAPRTRVLAALPEVQSSGRSIHMVANILGLQFPGNLMPSSSLRAFMYAVSYIEVNHSYTSNKKYVKVLQKLSTVNYILHFTAKKTDMMIFTWKYFPFPNSVTFFFLNLGKLKHAMTSLKSGTQWVYQPGYWQLISLQLFSGRDGISSAQVWHLMFLSSCYDKHPKQGNLG